MGGSPAVCKCPAVFLRLTCHVQGSGSWGQGSGGHRRPVITASWIFWWENPATSWGSGQPTASPKNS